MAQLVFHVQADYEEVIRLRNEIEKLKKELKGMDATVSPAAFNTLNTQLSASTQKMDELVTEAAKAGAEMEQGFKRKIFDASQTVNGFTEKIIAQKAVVKDVEADVKRLGEAYRTALKNNRYGGYGGGANNALAEYNAARRALDEEKAALFALTQEQATARLSVKKLRDEYALYRKEGGENVDATEQMKAAMLDMGKKVLGGIGIKEFIGQMIKVRGEFQAADTAIQTLLGSKEKADALMSQVREYAKISPLEFSDVTQATQMMLGFNIEAEKVPRFLQAIGDVSMGETQKFNSLTLAFSQMSAAGKLMGQDLNQMINAGFNPLQTMSEKTGKSIAQLKEEMSKGAISAEMVQQAFIDATSAGGKFYNMSENASKTINGQLSMMQDAMDAAFNEMGQKSEGFIMSGIQMTTTLIENYETVGKVLAGLVITYGTYRTALLVVSAIEMARNKTLWTNITATKAYTAAQAALNAVMKANPYVLVATAIVGLGTAIWALHDSTTAAEAAQESLNKTLDDVKNTQDEYNKKTQEAINIATDDVSATKDRKEALDLLINRYPSIIQKYIDEKGHLRDILKLKEEIAVLDGKRQRNEITKTLKDKGQNAFSLYSELDSFRKKQLNANNRFSDAERKRIEEIRKAYKEERGLSWYNIPSLEEMRDYYKSSAGKYRKAYARNLTENKLDLFSQGLGDKSTEELKALQKELERANKNRKSTTSVFVKSVGDYLTGEDRDALLTKVSGIVSSRTSSTYQQDLDKAKKEWSNAKAELSKIEKDKSKYTSKQYEEAKKRKETAEKAYKDLGGETPHGGRTATTPTTADDRLKEQKQEAEYQARMAQAAKDEKRAAEDMAMSTAQAEIDALEDGSEKTRKQIELDFKKRKTEIRRGYEDLIDTKVKNAKALFEANPKNEDKIFDPNSVDTSYTAAETANFNVQNSANVTERARKLEELRTAERQSLNSFLKDYGTYEEKKLAITEEYEKKIKDAQTTGEKLSLRVQMEKELKEIAEAAGDNTNWEAIFTNLDNYSLDYLKKIKERIKAELGKGNLSASDAASLGGRLDKVNAQIGQRKGVWKSMLGINILELEKINRLEAEAKTAQEAKEKAQDELNKKLLEEFSLREKIAGKINAQSGAKPGEANYVFGEDIKLSDAGKYGGIKDIANLFGKLASKTKEVTDAQKNLGTATDKAGSAAAAVSGASGASGAMGPAVADAIVHKVNDNIQSFSEAAEYLWDKDSDMYKSVQKFSESSQHATDALDKLKSGDFVGTALSLGKAVDSLGESFGLWSNSNREEVEKENEKLANAMAVNTAALDRLTAKLDEGSIADKAKVYEVAKSTMKANEEMELQTMRNNISMYDGGKSLQKDFNDTYEGGEMMQRISKIVGRTINTLQDFYTLSAKEMNKLYESPEGVKLLTDFTQAILSTQDEGNYNGLVDDTLSFMKKYSQEAYDELEDSFRAAVAGVSFDDFKRDFKSALMDMGKDGKDFAKNFSAQLTESVLNSHIETLFGKELEELYEDWNNALADGELSEDEAARLRAKQESITKKAMDERDKIAAVTGYDDISSSEASGSINSAKGMTEDTANELVGRVTAVQLTEERLAAGQQQQFIALTQISGNISAMVNQVSGIHNIADETRSILANSYMELQQINENTREVVKPIKLMQSDIAEMKRKL